MENSLKLISISNFNQWEMILLFYISIISIISFLIMGIDKGKAKNKKSRISEATLMGISVMGGSVGTLLAMIVFKHKTNKKKFYIGVPIIYLIDQIILLLIFNYIK